MGTFHLIYAVKKNLRNAEEAKMDECVELKFISFSFPCNSLNLFVFFFFFFSWQSSVRHHFMFIAVGICILRTYFSMFFFSCSSHA